MTLDFTCMIFRKVDILLHKAFSDITFAQVFMSRWNIQLICEPNTGFIYLFMVYFTALSVSQISAYTVEL
jgi:hypothetical protein